MKSLKYILFAAICVLFASCKDGTYDTPDSLLRPDAQTPYGNNAITETNVLTIAQLKQLYATAIATDYRDGQAYAQVDDDIMVKGYVTGNDISGNIYNEIDIQDNTGAIIIAVQDGGMNGYLPIGTEVLVSLKGLYVGNYGLQAEIGVPYTNASGGTYVSRMSNMLWNDHFKITGMTKVIVPEVFADGSTTTTWNFTDDAGKLGVLRNVSFQGIKDGSVYADPAAKTSATWYFNEQPKSVMMYNSPYADFSATALPQGKVNITGIFKRYNNTWEIIIRSIDDVQPTTND